MKSSYIVPRYGDELNRPSHLLHACYSASPTIKPPSVSPLDQRFIPQLEWLFCDVFQVPSQAPQVAVRVLFQARWTNPLGKMPRLFQRTSFSVGPRTLKTFEIYSWSRAPIEQNKFVITEASDVGVKRSSTFREEESGSFTQVWGSNWPNKL